MKRSYVAAGVLAIAIGGWILSGQFGPSSQADGSVPAPAAGARPEPALTAVRTRVIVAEPKPTFVVARGRTEMTRWVDLKAEVSGRVVGIDVPKGARVRAGDVLVRLAVDDRAAKLAEAQALVRQREAEFAAARALNEKGYRPDLKLAEAAALLDGARARAKQMEVEIAKLTIRAPFDGIVESRAVELGDFVKDGNKVLTVMDDDPLLVVAMVPEREIGRLKLGGHGRATIAGGDEVEGRIRYIAAAADPTTRTFRIEVELPNPEYRLRDGLTAELRIATGTVPAHYVTPAVLTLNERGQVGVRTVSDGDLVRFLPVSIIADGPEGVWIAGLPPRATIITVGQENVRDGEKVRPVAEKAGAGA